MSERVLFLRASDRSPLRQWLFIWMAKLGFHYLLYNLGKWK